MVDAFSKGSGAPPTTVTSRIFIFEWLELCAAMIDAFSHGSDAPQQADPGTPPNH
jgi:hypothetical protein